jgi:hypothetical protein
MQTLFANSRLGYVRRTTERPYKYWAMTVTGTMHGIGLIKVEFSMRPFSRNFGKSNTFQLYSETGEVTLKKPSGPELKRETEGELRGWYIASPEMLSRLRDAS